ncbi:MAG TPA: VOC family protein [Solirubrobacteraceae bacterium]|nr:VOC family protein [Solirubrobacteraceae bacterium]
MTQRTTRCEHAELRVGDLAKALDFYGNVMGLEEVGREDGRVYLSCAGTSRFDLAIVQKGAGIEHFGLLARGPEHVDEVAAHLREHGVATARVHDAEPGVQEALQFTLPGGVHKMEFILISPDGVRPESVEPPGDGKLRPLGIDHVNLKVADVQGTAEFLRDVVGLRISDVGVRGEEWIRAWTRLADHHHEVGLGRRVDAEETLSHLAFAMAGVAHIQVALDIMAAAGFQIETGIGRHRIGLGLYAYFREPGGNRFEWSVESEIVDPKRPPGFYGDLDDTFSAWVAEAHKYLPSSFMRGS